MKKGILFETMAHICGNTDRPFFLQLLGHTRQKKHPFKIGCKIIYEGRCLNILAYYCVQRVALLYDKS